MAEENESNRRRKYGIDRVLAISDGVYAVEPGMGIELRSTGDISRPTKKFRKLPQLPIFF
jgi:hypothetical protein